jgi:UDP-N-acetylglucosamine diphosphorylase / glucose-1-phosphate thymidylyltransferase / UDP-N-acetylgalactosamine diphosphorylase / glucosamine-1-phosphate N-acetyltransferase / galactosamine-1-phosphate N-acetyltransferase
MDAVILAAGLGTRLRPHTLHTPKPLLPVRGRPILDWSLGALPAEFDRVIVVVHYLAEQVEDYLQRQPHFSKWITVKQDPPRGTGDALLRCRAHIESERFFVLNGDDLYGADDLARLVQCPAGLLVHPVDEPKKFGIAFMRADGSLEKLVEKPNLEGRYPANTGAYLFTQRAFEKQLALSPRGEYEITDFVTYLAELRLMQAVEARVWLPIGTEEAWKQAQEMDLDTLLTARRPKT